jgi:hypothetical protein
MNVMKAGIAGLKKRHLIAGAAAWQKSVAKTQPEQHRKRLRSIMNGYYSVQAGQKQSWPAPELR